ncbi:MAG: 16S rRNA (uracil(1498)-N(3))-methyltransferase [Anaerolineae bacterium]
MHRFYLEHIPSVGTFTLPDTIATQISKVLRMRPGEVIHVFDGKGSEYPLTLTHVGRDGVSGELGAQMPEVSEPRTQITLYQSLLKKDKFEWVLEKGTEIGMARFVPMLTARTVADQVSENKLTRWQRICIEAAEQSRRTRIPEIANLQTLEQALDALTVAATYDLVLILHEAAAKVTLKQQLDLLAESAQSVGLLVGPEGGFTPDEVQRAAQCGIVAVNLGPRVLRAETAGLVAAANVLFALEG